MNFFLGRGCTSPCTPVIKPPSFSNRVLEMSDCRTSPVRGNTNLGTVGVGLTGVVFQVSKTHHTMTGSLPESVKTLCRSFEKGQRERWCRALAGKLLAGVTDRGGPASLCTTGLRTLCLEILGSMTPQMRRKGLRFLRSVVASLDDWRPLMDRMPRFLRSEPDRLLRQRRVVMDDSVPKRLNPPWLRDLFQDIITSDYTTAWKTSKTARQQLSLVYKFLRQSPWLRENSSREQFERTMQALDTEEVMRCCQAFLDGCRSRQAARRYVCILNLLFADLWTKLPQRFRREHLHQKRRFCTLRDLEESQGQSHSSAPSGEDRSRHQRDYFTPAEAMRLQETAAGHPRDNLIVVLLLTTGLRRQALLNIRIVDVLEWNTSRARWVALQSGVTLTKGRKRHQFLLLAPARLALERWMNTAEPEGGRPRSPSPFLLPSASHDNGQLSDTALYKIFRSICERAGFSGDKRCHPHSLRHTYAHDLVDAHNPLSVVQVCLGHESIKNTQQYIRETNEDVMRKLVRPAHWGPSETSPVPSSDEAPPPKRQRASRETLKSLLLRRAERDRSMTQHANQEL